jgi:hypothetical protein
MRDAIVAFDYLYSSSIYYLYGVTKMNVQTLIKFGSFNTPSL